MKRIINIGKKKISNGIILLFILFSSGITMMIKKEKSNRILLVEGGHMGDAIVDASAIEFLIQKYRAQGKRMFVLCSKQTWNTLHLFTFTEHLQYIGYTPDRTWELEDVLCLHRKVKKYQFDEVIGLTSSPYLLWYALGCVLASQKSFLVEPERMNGFYGWVVRWLCLMQRAQIMIGDGKTSRAQWLEQYLGRLGMTGYQYSIVHIEEQGNIEKLSYRYISIVMDSADSWKRWPVEKFMKLSRVLLETFPVHICYLGTDQSDNIRTAIENNLVYAKDRIHNLVGKTSISEWVEWIRGSEFLIGVDSGAVHIAASVGTVAFCINGWWHGNRFLPYSISAWGHNVVAPLCITNERSNLICQNCAAHRYAGYGNKKCLARIRRGNSCLCLDRISVDDVIKLIGNTVNY